MNLLDENIPLEQRDLLRGWGVHCRAIGQDIAESSIGDDNIVVLMHRLKQPTLFTRDGGFFKRKLCLIRHTGWCGWMPLLKKPRYLCAVFCGILVFRLKPGVWALLPACTTMAFSSGNGSEPRSKASVGHNHNLGTPSVHAANF